MARMGETVLYFAYGSNMKTEQMTKRVPSAKVIGRARIVNRHLVCNKRSKNGSGKANLVHSPGDVVWGVLYEMDESDLPKLDKAEGGYRRVEVEVLDEQGGPIVAQTYVSKKLTDDTRAYEGYKNLILNGAREHQLPEKYIEDLESIPTKPEPGENP